MNALPFISHRLLVSAVVEHRGLARERGPSEDPGTCGQYSLMGQVRSPGAVADQPAIIQNNDTWSAPSADLEKSAVTDLMPPAPSLLQPTPISASWPFFE